MSSVSVSRSVEEDRDDALPPAVALDSPGTRQYIHQKQTSPAFIILIGSRRFRRHHCGVFTTVPNLDSHSPVVHVEGDVEGRSNMLNSVAHQLVGYQDHIVRVCDVSLPREDLADNATGGALRGVEVAESDRSVCRGVTAVAALVTWQDGAGGTKHGITPRCIHDARGMDWQVLLNTVAHLAAQAIAKPVPTSPHFTVGSASFPSARGCRWRAMSYRGTIFTHSAGAAKVSVQSLPCTRPVGGWRRQASQHTPLPGRTPSS
ncbi:hypothetical protein SUDANB106_05196 [Streptomyces sp. enrichment culture]